MTNIAQHIVSNLALFGLSSESELKLIARPKSKLEDGGRWLTMLALRTIQDNTRGVPFNNLLQIEELGVWTMGGVVPSVPYKVRGERFLTLLEIECKMRAPDPGKDFYWNTVRQFRDKVYDALAGPGRGGLVITRYDRTDPDNPIRAGEIWFRVDPARNTPLEDPIEDPKDPAIKSIFMTYNVHWWRPVS